MKSGFYFRKDLIGTLVAMKRTTLNSKWYSRNFLGPPGDLYRVKNQYYTRDH